MIQYNNDGIDIKLLDAKALTAVLEAAAGVSRNGNEDPEHLNRWKYVCAYNFKKIDKVAEKAEVALRSIMNVADTPDWHDAVDTMLQVAGDVGLNLLQPDFGATALKCGTNESVAAGMFQEADIPALDDFIKEFKKHDCSGNLMGAVFARVEAIEKSAVKLDETVHVPVRQIDFKFIPERLHGGYIRDLLWMVKNIPENFVIEEADDGQAD